MPGVSRGGIRRCSSAWGSWLKGASPEHQPSWGVDSRPGEASVPSDGSRKHTTGSAPDGEGLLVKRLKAFHFKQEDISWPTCKYLNSMRQIFAKYLEEVTRSNSGSAGP